MLTVKNAGLSLYFIIVVGFFVVVIKGDGFCSLSNVCVRGFCDGDECDFDSDCSDRCARCLVDSVCYGGLCNQQSCETDIDCRENCIARILSMPMDASSNDDNDDDNADSIYVAVLFLILAAVCCCFCVCTFYQGRQP